MNEVFGLVHCYPSRMLSSVSTVLPNHDTKPQYVTSNSNLRWGNQCIFTFVNIRYMWYALFN